MAAGSAFSFHLQMGGRSVQVCVYSTGGSSYKVYFAHSKKLLGTMTRVRSKFICKDKKTGQKFGGTTRQQAVTSMLYDCYPEGEP
jgi:hypothetical protein